MVTFVIEIAADDDPPDGHDTAEACVDDWLGQRGLRDSAERESAIFTGALKLV